MTILWEKLVKTKSHLNAIYSWSGNYNPKGSQLQKYTNLTISIEIHEWNEIASLSKAHPCLPRSVTSISARQRRVMMAEQTRSSQFVFLSRNFPKDLWMEQRVLWHISHKRIKSCLRKGNVIWIFTADPLRNLVGDIYKNFLHNDAMTSAIYLRW